MKKLLCVAAIGLALTTTYAMAKDSRELSHNFTVNGASQLDIDFPVGSLEVESYDGSEVVVTVRIEPLIEKSLPLVIELRGKPAAGFTLAERIVKPETVRVRGPESVVSAQTGIRIKPVDIGGVSESFEKRVVPDLADPLKRVGTEPFILKLDVREKIVSTRLAGIPIEGRGTAQIFEISPPSLTMTVKGPFRQIQRLRENPDFAVYVDFTGLGPGVYVRRAVILLPVDIVLTKTDPELFTIRIKK